MKAILLVALSVFFNLAHSYEGQPANVYMMKNPAEMVLVSLPDVRFAELELKKSDSCADKCYGSFLFPENATMMIGNVTYRVDRLLTEVNSNGEVIQPMQVSTLRLVETLTGTNLTFALGSRTVSCFGGRSKGLCTEFSVVDRY